MLLEALKYFAVKSFGVSSLSHLTNVTGETYWVYRLYAEGLLFGVICAGLLASAFLNGGAKSQGSLVVAGVLTAAVGMLELLRLLKLLRAQVEFAEQYYG